MTQAVAPKRRRFLLAAVGGAGAVALGTQGCAASIFPFIPDHYTFSQAQVQDAVQRKFPLERRASQIFDVTLSNPLVGLAPDRNRITVRLDARLATPFMPNPVTGLGMNVVASRASSRTVIRLRSGARPTSGLLSVTSKICEAVRCSGNLRCTASWTCAWLNV